MGTTIFNGDTTGIFGGNTTTIGDQDLFGKPISKNALDFDIAEELIKPLASVTAQNEGSIGGDIFGKGIENASFVNKGFGGKTGGLKQSNQNSIIGGI